MNSDRLMLFTSNLELKKLKEEAKALGDEVERLDEQIRPVERKFTWEMDEIEIRIENIKVD